jgi:hypothetical protein
MLEYQNLPVEITGLDTKTDPNKLSPGGLITMENCVMQKTGRLSPRRGWDPTSSSLLTHTIQALSGEQAVFIKSDGSVVQIGSGGATGASTSILKPKTALLADTLATISGALVSGEWAPSKSQFAVGARVGIGFSNAVAGSTLSVYAWGVASRSTNSIREIAISSGLVACTVDKDPGGIDGHIVYCTGGAWYYERAIGTGLTASPKLIPSIVYAGTNASDRMDCTYVRGSNGLGYLAVAWYDHGTTAIKIVVVDEANNQTTFTVASGAVTSLCVTRTYDNKIMITAARAGDTLIQIYTGNVLTSSQTPVIAGAVVTATAGASSFYLYRQNSPTSVSRSAIDRGTLLYTTTYMPGSVATSADCNSDAWDHVVIRTTPDTSKPALTSYAMYVLGQYSGSMLGDQAAPLAYTNPHELSVGNTTISFPLTRITQLNTTLGEAGFEVVGEFFDRATTAETVKTTWIPWNNSYITTAYGTVMGIDLRPYPQGNSVQNVSPYPLGFASAPIKPAVSTNAGAGIVAGIYTFCSVYEFQDFQGNVMYSVPSITETVNLGGAVLSFNVGIGSVPFQGVRVTVYRTQVNGSVFYKILDKATAGTYTSATLDTDLVGSQPLYTTGGILESAPVPPARGIFYAKNRAWLISAESDNVVFYSTEVRPRELPRFNESLILHVNPTGGELKAVAEMDDKIIIFRENAIYLSYGQGPDETGYGQFQEPILISQSLGCISPRSIVLTDAGLMFMSHEGIYVLTKQLQLSYIGAPVEQYNSLTIMAAHNLIDRHQIHLMSTEGTTLCFDEYHKIWSTFTQPPSFASCIFDGGFIYLGQLSGYKILRDLASIATDDGVPFNVKFKTGMISLAGIHGFQRIRNITMLGLPSNDTTIQTYVDYDASTLVDTFTRPSSAVQMQWQHKPTRQRCEALAFEYSAVASTSWYFVSVALEVGAKKGTYKFDRSKRT